VLNFLCIIAKVNLHAEEETMPSAFYRTTRSLSLDRFRFSVIGILVAIAILLLWIAWSLWFKISLYEVSDSARIEVVSAVHPVAAPISGPITRADLVLGQEVQRGDTLFVLDARVDQLRLGEQQLLLPALQNELTTLQNHIREEQEAMAREEKSTQIALEEAMAQFKVADASTKFAKREVERNKELFDKGLISESEFQLSQSEAEKLQASSDAYRLAIDRIKMEHNVRQSDRKSKIEGLQRELATLMGKIAMAEKTVDRLEQEVENYIIRAPISGTIGEMLEIKPGSVVSLGEKLVSLVPAGEVMIVAQFSKQEAVGRISPGQTAEMRLDAYPWMQFGTVKAQVANVGSESTNGKVRVDLSIQSQHDARFSIRHGLTGAVEVEVNQIRPVELILRKIGTWIKA
jgi:membrane fusion protein (multidrug efflux system)